MARRRARIGALLEPLPRWWYRMYSTPEHTMMNTYSVPACMGGREGGWMYMWVTSQQQEGRA